MSDDIVSRVGGAILLAETEWTPKAGVSKERAMALAAIEAMREATDAMIDAVWEQTGDPCWRENAIQAWQSGIDAALKP